MTEIPDDDDGKARDAARLRAEHTTLALADIAKQLGLPSADEAKRAVMAGLGLLGAAQGAGDAP